MKLRFCLLTVGTIALCSCGGNSGDDLGTQIDGMGRSAINTALIKTFTDDTTRGIAEDDFNSTPNSSLGRFSSDMAASLAIYDALVGTCGDNPLTNRASADPADGLASGPLRYNFLATVLADDQLYLNSSSGGAAAGQCNQYLSAELGVVGVTGLESDCGGRNPLQDTIATTYSAVAIGAASGVDDGLGADNFAHSTTAFPFLAAPQG